MDKLASSEERQWSEYREAPTKGVYVFYELRPTDLRGPLKQSAGATPGTWRG